MRPWRIALGAGAALAAGIGVGRFVFTPILPLMQEQAGLTPGQASGLATANYAGYLAGALLAVAAPRVAGSAVALRASLVVVVASLALVPASSDVLVWGALRFVAGVASAFVFVVAVSTLLTRLRDRAGHLAGWGFGGVGAGIALSGAAVLALHDVASWRVAWWAAAALGLALTAVAWPLVPGRPRPRAHREDGAARGGFWPLATAYSLEGVGYIVAGTFLVAAVAASAGGVAGGGAWVVVGLAALPSTAAWTWLSARRSRPALLVVALLAQAVGVALPAVAGGVLPAMAAAVLFGATFMGIGALALGIGEAVGPGRAVAILTTGYSAGQIAGPLLVTPLLDHGYRSALLVGAATVLLAAAAAAALWWRTRPRPRALPWSAALAGRSMRVDD